MSKRKAGSNKCRRKQRDYQRHVRAQLASGLINSADGAWVSSSMADSKVRDRAEKQAARFR